VAVLWLVSGFVEFSVAWSRTNQTTRIIIVRGCLCVSTIYFPDIKPSPIRPTAERLRPIGWDWRYVRDRGLHIDRYYVPLWWAAAPLPGRCPACGYDTDNLSACPECGKPTPSQTSAAPPR
jgi:hypothetical protein